MTKNCIPYKIVLPKNKKVGILLSIPHSGTNFPQELSANYNKELSTQPDDTDWYLEKLYDFAAELGITTIQALNSRWVIDLNRNPENTSLYDDGRIITALCPTTDFLGQQIYINKNAHPSKSEVQRRLDTYYWPYHHKIDELIKSLKNEFNRVILWDAHSIRRKVETIQNDPFPDLILGEQ
ncbi:MAG: N-formylglutamate amidohydrolase [Parvicellaceae bacterium]